MKQVVRRLALAVGILLTSPAWVLARLGLAAGNTILFDFLAQGMSLFPGFAGNSLRLGFYYMTLTRISADATIQFGSYFSKHEAEVGKNVCIGAYCILGKVTLGDDVLIASRVSIISGKHQHGNSLLGSRETTNQPMFQRVTIGARTWIGEGAIVGADVGEDCIVGPGGVVMRRVPEEYLILGNPMKLIKRKRETPEAQDGQPG